MEKPQHLLKVGDFYGKRLINSWAPLCQQAGNFHQQSCAVNFVFLIYYSEMRPFFVTLMQTDKLFYVQKKDLFPTWWTELWILKRDQSRFEVLVVWRRMLNLKCLLWQNFVVTIIDSSSLSNTSMQLQS